MMKVEAFSDKVPSHIAGLAKRWVLWRRGNPVRGKHLGSISVTTKPTKRQQFVWQSYSITAVQEWLFVFFLVEDEAPPLIGAPEETKLMHVLERGHHYHSIDRLEALAEVHPNLLSVRRHNTYKEKDDDPSQFDEEGRCTQHHQSPFNLMLTAASGATFEVGYSIHGVAQGLASIWWKQCQGMNDKNERDKARAIFFDLAEAEHIEPNLGDKSEQAWAEGHAALANVPSLPSTPRTASGVGGSRLGSSADAAPPGYGH